MSMSEAASTGLLGELGLTGAACDAHLHVYEPRFALAPTATFVPPDAPAGGYAAVQRALGFSRCVVVQPTGYGFDNRCTLQAMAALGPGARGVVVIAPDAGPAEIERLHATGVRGVRFMMLAGGVLGWDALSPIADRIAPFGWHIDLQLDGHDLPQHLDRLQALPCALVVDHIGKFLSPVTVASPGFVALARLLDGGRCWIKLAAPYESSRDGPPDYRDIAPLVQALAEGWPERGLWASNWPHPNIRPTPSTAHLLRWALQQVGPRERQQRLLVDNPAGLYGY